MYLKSIKASGFKSFADKIELDINGGITCIVGPNGSGKSNVVDAIRWVLGEQSVKSLRGTGSMTDIIFNGSKTRNPMARAYVSLTFDNQDHYLNSEFGEIEVKRVVYKTGENEYFLNNTKVRLKDITDLFIDSGASKESFNIISQGTVEDVVNSKPEARRVILEEASGVLKYKKHKEESLRKLEHTKDNLEKLDLVMEELNTSLKPLETQSKKAKKYLEYKNDLENIEVSLLAKEIKDLDESYKKLMVTQASLKEKVSSLEKDNSLDTSKLSSLKLKDLEMSEEISKNQEIVLGLEKRLSEIESHKQLIMERKKYEVDKNLLEDNRLSLQEEVLGLEKKEKSLKNELDLIDKELNDLINKKETINNDLLVNRKEYLGTLSSLENKNKELLQIKNKKEILENNLEQDIKTPLPVKSIINNPRLKGIHSTIAKLMEVDSNYTLAIDISLGANSHVIVVDTDSSAKEAIQYLKENHLGRATFFPLNIIKGRFVDKETLDVIKKDLDFIGVAKDLVKYDEKYEVIFANQLGNVIVVRDLDALNRIGRLTNHKYKIVTLEGDIAYSGGAMMGGSVKSNHSLLSDRNELLELENRKNILEEEIHLLEERVESEKNIVSSKEENVEELERKSIRKKETWNEKSRLWEENHHVLARKQEELQSTESRLSNELDLELEKATKEYYEVSTNKEMKVQELNQKKSLYSDLKTEMATLEQENRRKMSEYNKIEQEVHQNEVSLGKMGVRLDTYLKTLNEEYNVTYEKVIHEVDVAIDVDAMRLEVSKLKNLIRDLGEVNTGSIPEYERILERYTFLDKQRNDLNTSIEELLHAISEMDEIMKKKFKETFHKVNDEFKTVFTTLFRGGEGHLELTNPEDLLETGIDIIAEPPGKKLNSIALLSGGERTLTAIALLFSILNVKVVPFVVLDEVEAALDEANVDVFGHYLEQKKEKSQFIIITHKKRTMEYADVLYGITMQEQGVSKLVSVKLEK